MLVSYCGPERQGRNERVKCRGAFWTMNLGCIIDSASTMLVIQYIRLIFFNKIRLNVILIT